MSARDELRGTGAVPLFHVLAVVSGLALVTALRLSEREAMLVLWASTLAATLLGLTLSWLRVRLWLVLFVVFNAMWAVPVGAIQLVHELSTPWPAVEIFLLAFAPGALSAYFATSERAGLVSFWFPTSLWTLAILDRSDDLGLSGASSWVLTCLLAAMLLGSFRMQETRRVALFRTHALRRLAEAHEPVVRSRSPLRSVAQLGYVAVMALATLGLTAWVAPELWQREERDEQRVASAVMLAPETTDGVAGDLGCCVESSFEATPRSQVKEYFPFLHPRGERPAPPRASECVACRDGVPIRSGGAGQQVAGQPVVGGGDGTGAVVTGGADAVVAGGDAVLPPSGSGLAAGAPVPNPALDPTVAVPPRVAPKPPSLARPPAPLPVVRAGSTGTPRALPPARPVVIDEVPSVDLVSWLLGFALAAAIVQIMLRPLRRTLVLRHLARPFWPETVDQRVSNLWQLMLVGLRDAGVRAVPGESPHELARRVALDGVSACASVLERTRHGVRVDAEDLASMERGARAVYAAARAQAGLLSRAWSWLRWPLI
jgi:hypothetical protein